MKIVFKGSKDDLYDMIDKAEFSPEERAELDEMAAEEGLTFEASFERWLGEWYAERL